jgi:glycosyltransferase involved in cell wall biosynthesis
MRIGVFCTNEYTTPPPNRVIYAPLQVTQQVADGLVERGHSVTMFAPLGSRVKSKLYTNKLPPLLQNKKLASFIPANRERAVASYEQIAISSLIHQAERGKFDIVHIHPAIRGIYYAPLTRVPVVFTLHDPIIPARKFFFETMQALSPNAYYISISNAQRKPAPNLQWAGTAYNGVYPEKFPFTAKPGKHFTIIGRMVPQKGMYEAILAAKKARVPLRIAGSPNCGPYWERKIKPHLSRTIQYVGMIPYREMPKFLSTARGFLFPIQWEEPFGLVMIEAMATGAPVIAFPRGSVREIVKHGKTGFIVPNVNEMAKAIKRIDTIDRSACRSYVETHFSVSAMVDSYEQIFKKLIRQSKHNGQKRR